MVLYYIIMIDIENKTSYVWAHALFVFEFLINRDQNRYIFLPVEKEEQSIKTSALEHAGYRKLMYCKK